MARQRKSSGTAETAPSMTTTYMEDVMDDTIPVSLRSLSDDELERKLDRQLWRYEAAAQAYAKEQARYHELTDELARRRA